MPALLDSREAQAYREAAVAFCTLVENRHQRSTPEWLDAVHLVLANLYAAALALPHVKLNSANTNARAISHDEWQSLYTDLANRLGGWEAYFAIYDPYNETDREPMWISLADDLADIYRDVKEGLLPEQSDAAAHPNDRLWEWRHEFESHWSAHAAGALRALQSMLFMHYVADLPDELPPRDRPKV